MYGKGAQALLIQILIQWAFALANFFSKAFFRVKTDEVEVTCYWKMLQ